MSYHLNYIYVAVLLSGCCMSTKLVSHINLALSHPCRTRDTLRMRAKTLGLSSKGMDGERKKYSVRSRNNEAKSTSLMKNPWVFYVIFQWNLQKGMLVNGLDRIVSSHKILCFVSRVSKLWQYGLSSFKVGYTKFCLKVWHIFAVTDDFPRKICL